MSSTDIHESTARAIISKCCIMSTSKKETIVERPPAAIII